MWKLLAAIPVSNAKEEVNYTPSYDECNSRGDWPVPESIQSTLKKVVIFSRHGSRSRAKMTHPCWKGTRMETYDCRMQIPLPGIATPSIYNDFKKQESASRMKYDFFFSSLARESTQEIARKEEDQEAAESYVCRSGQLLVDGFRQHINNGKSIRKQYGERLSLGKSIDETVSISSTNVQRTVSSARAFVEGLFPELDPKTPYEISYNSRNDPMVPTKTRCAGRFMNNLDAYWGSEWIKGQLEESLELRKKLSDISFETNILAENPETIHQSFGSIRDCIVSASCPMTGVSGLRTPNLLTKGDTELVILYASEWLARQYSVPSLRRYGIGPLLGEILEILQTQKKLYLFSGHDTGPLFPLVLSLELTSVVEEHMGSGEGLPLREWPPYATMLILEVYDDSVRFLWNGVPVSIGVIPECAGNASCPLSLFEAFLVAGTPSFEECEQQDADLIEEI